MVEGRSIVTSVRVSHLRSCTSPVYACTHYCSGTRRHDILPIGPAHLKLRVVAWLCHTVIFHDGSFDPYDHILHFNQAILLNAGDDHLLCKVFPGSLKGPALAWFHKLLWSSINSFSELWETFVSQYLCSVRQKGNISSLHTIFKQEDESIRDFTRRFGGAVQQIDSYSMDVVLQNFRRSFGPTTPFFHSLSLDPPTTMEELYRQTNKYSTLEDNIRAASQTMMITAQSGKPTTKGQLEPKGSKNQKRSPRPIREKEGTSAIYPLNI